MKAHLTEKSVTLANTEKPVFTFLVKKSDTAFNLKKQLNRLFKVDAVDIRFINTDGKQVRFRGRKGQKSSLRKAIVTLKPKQRIDLFDIQEEKKAEKKPVKKEKE